MAAYQLVHQVARDVVDRPRLVGAFLGDAGVEHDLQEDVAQLLAQRFGVVVLEGLQRLVGLLEQVRRQAGVGLFGVPRTTTGRPQPVHHRDDVEQPGTGRVPRPVDDLELRGGAALSRDEISDCPGEAGVPVRPGEPYGDTVVAGTVAECAGPGAVVGAGDRVHRDPGGADRARLVGVGIGGMDGTCAQGIPGRPGQDTGRHAGRGRDEQQPVGH